MSKPTLEERFWAKVDRTGGPDACWEWRGARKPRGYGNLVSSGRYTSSHRTAYELAHGPIPDGMCVMHRCDNPPCCNPGHLHLGTHADNMAEMVTRGRSKGAIGPRPDWAGERNRNSKLSTADVASLRAALASGETGRSVAARFGISPAQVSRIKNGTRRTVG